MSVIGTNLWPTPLSNTCLILCKNKTVTVLDVCLYPFCHAALQFQRFRSLINLEAVCCFLHRWLGKRRLLMHFNTRFTEVPHKQMLTIIFFTNPNSSRSKTAVLNKTLIHFYLQTIMKLLPFKLQSRLPYGWIKGVCWWKIGETLWTPSFGCM